VCVGILAMDCHALDWLLEIILEIGSLESFGSIS